MKVEHNSFEKQTKSEKKYGIHPDVDFDQCNVASSSDLTGLIPSAPSCEAEVNHYGDMYAYQPQDVTNRKKEVTHK